MNGWLCHDCKSVNSTSASNCYRCWTPRKFAEAPDPATLPPGVTVDEAHAQRKQELRPKLEDARSSRRRSWFVIACITVTVAFSAMSLAFMGAKGGTMGIIIGLVGGDWTTMGSLLAISLVGGVLALLSAIAWFVWFDRVLGNVAPLTGKWPEIGRPMAVIWWLVPIVGQLKGTFVVGHIYELMAVAGSPGLWLLGMWGVTWVGGTMAPNVASFIVGWLPLPLEETIRLQDLIANLGQMSYIAAGFFAVALILAFEHARDVRMAGQASDLAQPESELARIDRMGAHPQPPQTPSWANQGTGGVDWPLPPIDQSSDPMAWPGAPTSPMDPSLPAWMPSPSWDEMRAGHLTEVAPVTSPDPFQPPAATRSRRRDRGPVPFEPILLMGALVLAGVVGGITMAGMADPFGDLGRAGRDLAGGPGATPTPTLLVVVPWSSPSPVATEPSTTATEAPADPTPEPLLTPEPVPASAQPAPTVAPSVAAVPTVAPTATPIAADVVARRLVRLATDERYRGLADIEATYTDATGDTTWSLDMGRVGGREYRLQDVRRPGSDPDVLERVSLVSTVWERGERTDWVQRRKTEADRPTPALFDLTDPSEVSFDGTVDEDGTRLYRFQWSAGVGRIREFVERMGGAEGMSLASGQLFVTEAGVPVRLELRLVGDASGDGVDPSLAMTVSYSEIGSDIEIRNPRVGPPLVVRS